MEHQRPLHSLSDDELLLALTTLLGQSRRTEAELVAHIAEVDRRRLYAREASPSMFSYCTEVLHLSECEAYLRIRAARASRKLPVILDLLADGRLHLSGIARLVPHLTAQNGEALLGRAVHRSKREIEELVAEIAPRPDVAGVVRRLPDRPARPLDPEPALSPSIPPGPDVRSALEPVPDAAPTSVAELRPDAVGQHELRADGVASRPAIEPLAPARYKVQFTANAELRDKIERLQALMRSEVPDGDLAKIIEKAVTEKLERLETRRQGRTSAPRKSLSESDVSSGSRHIPAAVRRAVCERDGNRCRYVDARGRRCPERQRLEYHHRHPFGLGGNHAPGNISLLCRAHNLYLAELDYGREAIVRHRRPLRA